MKPKSSLQHHKSVEIATKVGTFEYYPWQNTQNIASAVVIKQVFNTVV